MKIKILLFLFVLLFQFEINAQCTITGTPNVNSSTITCTSLNSCTVVYIGDGTNATNLVMNANLDLTCLGAIQLVVRNNAYIDFSFNNFDLRLAANSSIVLDAGGNIGSTSNCSASDMIKIGGVNVATCNGGGSGSPISFPNLVLNGGFNTVIASATSICGSGTSIISASKTPAPTSSTTYNFYTVASGGSAVSTINATSSPFTATYTTPTLSATTTYYVEATTSGVTTPRRAVVVTVNPIPATPSVTLIQPTCSIATGTITVNSPSGSGLTFSINGSIYTNTTGVFAGVTSGTYNVTARNSAGCTSAITSATINAQPVTPVQPTVASLAQPTCTLAVGSFVITNYNAAYTYTISPSLEVTRTGSTVTAPAGTYSVTATLGLCTSIASSNITISQQPTNTWSSSGWSNGTPTAAQRLIFSHDYSSTENVSGCTCTVTSGAVVFNSGHTLNIANEVTVNSGGSLTFLDNASLVQINDLAINSGNITYNRTTRTITRWAYVYWGSPVEGNVFSQIPSQFDLGYRWQSGSENGAWLPLSDTTVGEGFITRVRNIAPFSSGTGTVNFAFTGKPNNGIININVDSFNNSSMVLGNTVLLANPYPSAIDALKFLQHSNNTELGGTLFFWTAVTLYSGSGNYNFQDYGSWNSTGGTAPVTHPSLIPNGIIAAGQGFFSQVFNDGQISFNNFMRETGNNTQFFRSSVTTVSTEDDIEKNRIWLNLSGENRLRQTLLGYVTGATNSLDRLYDGDSFTSNEIDIYSVLDNHNLVIQGKALPFIETDVVPIGYRVSIPGNYTISIANTDGIFAGKQNIYLIDKKTGVYHDLRTGVYSFASVSGIFNNRFEIRYINAIETTTSKVSDNEIEVVSNYQGISVYCTSTKINKIQIFNVLGKLLFDQNSIDSNSLEAIQLSGKKQILIVKVTLDNGLTFTKKTLIN